MTPMGSKTGQGENIGVIGAGAFGTALATIAAQSGRAAVIYGRDPARIAEINEHRTNARYLPDVRLPDAISASTDPGALAPCDIILVAVPAQATRKVTRALANTLRRGVYILACAKGIERETGASQVAILSETLPQRPLAVLSGPGFAADIAKALPTAVTIAADALETARYVADRLATPSFRPYASTDVTGVELGGALKNVIAIACGIAEGCKFGESARAALTARGFAEITRLGLALGAKRETMAGLSGLGDLILTCNSMQSRNMSLGAALGEGQSLKDIMASRNTVAEGVPTSGAVVQLARSKSIEMPIAEAVNSIVTEEKTVSRAILDLLARPFTSEGT